MRVKIEGPVTAERLEFAFERALSELRYQGVEGTPNNAFICLSLRDEKGNQIKLDDDLASKTLVIKRDESKPQRVERMIARTPINLKPASTPAPAPAIIEATPDNTEVLPTQKPVGEDQALPIAPPLIATGKGQKRTSAPELVNAQRKSQTALVLKHFGLELETRLNELVDAVWDELKPIHKRRPHVGEPVTKPIFEVSEDRKFLRLQSSVRQHTIPITSPMGSYFNDGTIKLPWMTREWLTVVKRSAVLMEELHERAIELEEKRRNA